jgi:hypothetical protein
VAHAGLAIAVAAAAEAEKLEQQAGNSGDPKLAALLADVHYSTEHNFADREAALRGQEQACFDAGQLASYAQEQLLGSWLCVLCQPTEVK